MRTLFVNLTNHVLSDAQIADIASRGWEITELPEDHRPLITFTEVPSRWDLYTRATRLGRIVASLRDTHGYDCEIIAMVGGAPYFMEPLEGALSLAQVKPIHAFTQRMSQEDPETGVKTSVFVHAGWVGLDD